MDMDVKFDAGWERWTRGTELGRNANEQGLRRAGAETLRQIGINFQKRGRPRWKPLTRAYKKRKRKGLVVPHRQMSSSARGLGDNVLTGALLRATIARPKSNLTRFYIDLWPNPAIRLNKLAVGRYADFVERIRPFMTVPRSALKDVALEYEIGFLNVLNGVPDPVGRQLG